jgi:hypothetical protein
LPLSWSAIDAGSGVANYKLEYWKGTGLWETLLNASTATSYTFSGLDPYTYSFRVSAQDTLGNVSAPVSGTVAFAFPDLTVDELGEIGREVCDALSVAALDPLCDGLSVIGPPLPPPTPATPPRIALVSSGIACSDLPNSMDDDVRGIEVTDDTTISCANLQDQVGYGTWATTVLKQQIPSVRIDSFDVFVGGAATDAKLSAALAYITTHASSYDVVLSAFSPRDILDPTSWALEQRVTQPSAATQKLNNLWDLINEAITAHPYISEDGTPMIGLPLDQGLRARFLADVPAAQAKAINDFAGRTDRWSTIRSNLQAISAAGVPIIVGTGEIDGTAPTQSIVGIAALPEVITVGPSVFTDGHDQLSVRSAKGPAPDLSLKPDLLVDAGIVGAVPSSSSLADITDASLPNDAGFGSALSRINAGWSVPAAALVAADAAAMLKDDLGAAATNVRAAVVRGALQTLASRHPAYKRTGTDANNQPIWSKAPAWEQGAGVLRDTRAGETSVDRIPADFTSLPIPLDRFVTPGVAVGASTSKSVSFWSGGIDPGTASLSSSLRFLGPNNGGVAVELPYSGEHGIALSNTTRQIVMGISPASSGHTFQGGLYCADISSGVFGWPACVLRDRRVTFTSTYLLTDSGEKTEDETFVLQTGLPAEVGVVGKAFKFVPLEPEFVPFGSAITGEVGSATFDAVPPAFYRVLHFGRYQVPGGYSDFEDPTKTLTSGRRNYLKDTWSLQYTTDASGSVFGWNTVESVGSPRAVFDAASAYDSARQRVVMFGGRSDTGVSGETWLYNPTTQTWTKANPATSPPAREGAAMAFDPSRGVAVLHGGLDANGILLSDTWVWNGTTWSQPLPPIGVVPAVMQARAYPQMAYDSQRARIVMFGGKTPSGTGDPFINDQSTFVWAGAWTQLTTTGTPPAPRARHAMAYDPARDRMVMFGGQGATSLLRDAFELNGSVWSDATPNPSSHSLVSESAPRPGIGQLAYGKVSQVSPTVPVRKLILWQYTRGIGRTWTYDGTSWLRLENARGVPISSPPSRVGGAFVYDPVGEQAILVGGLAPQGRTLGLQVGASAQYAAIPGRPLCSDQEIPLGPLGLSNPGWIVSPQEGGTGSCISRTSLEKQYGVSQVKDASEVKEAGDSMCELQLNTQGSPSNFVSTEDIYCDPTSFAIGSAVTTRYVDLIRPDDWERCGVIVDATSRDYEAMIEGATCGLTGSEPEPRWEMETSAEECPNPLAGDANLEANYDPKLLPTQIRVQILHYRFKLPKPNWYANMHLNLTYSSQNTLVSALATTGSGTTLGPPAASVLVTPNQGLSIDPSTAAISPSPKRGTVTSQLSLWPEGVGDGDLYLVLVPTSFANTTLTDPLITAKTSLCEVSFEFDTYAKIKPTWTNTSTATLGVDIPRELFTDQLKGPIGSASTHWTRDGWDPQANAGAGAWVPFAEETETVHSDIHVPKDWDPDVPFTSGTPLRPDKVSWRVPVRPSTDPPIGEPTVGATSGQTMADPGMQSLIGRLFKAPVDRAVTDPSSLNSSTVAGDDWKVNGRFFGVLDIPESILRVGHDDPLISGDPPVYGYKLWMNTTTPTATCSGTAPMLTWRGLTRVSPCVNGSPWTYESRLPVNDFVPYAIPGSAGYNVVHGAASITSDGPKLKVELEPPAGATTTLTFDQACIPANPTGCVT